MTKKKVDKKVLDSFNSAFRHSDYPGKKKPTPDGTPYMPIPKPPPTA